MKRSYGNSADRSNDSLEDTRRLYRGATDIAKRLDEQKSCALTVSDVFTPAGEVLRAKLKDYCERLVLKDPVSHARKIEELLWRRGFYDVVAAAKKLRKGNVWSDTEKALLFTHINVGVGFYHHLIFRLQEECGLDLPGVVDFAFPQRKDITVIREKNPPLKLHSEESRQCAMKIVHRSLICLGDLARYKLDLDPNWDPMVATRYYKMAIAVDPNIGMSHNQLGTLAGNRNYGIDAVYHYLRCTLCSEPFEGTEGNLKRVISTHFYYGKEKLPSQRCAARLFTLLQKWDKDSSSVERINEDCENLLIEMENCLNLEKTESPSRNPPVKGDTIEEFLLNTKTEESPHLTENVVFKMVAICLMSISKLQSKESLHVQSAIAFILSLLSKLIQITIVHLQQSIIEASSNGEVGDLIISLETIEKIEINDLKGLDLNDNTRPLSPPQDKKNGNVKENAKKSRDKSKYLLHKLRRPRKRFNSSDSDGSDMDPLELASSSDELNSDISETEEEDELSQGQDDPSEEEFENDPITENENSKDPIIETNGHEKDQGGDKCLPDENNPPINQIAEENENNICNGDRKSPDREFIAQLKKQNLNARELLGIFCKEELLQSIKICFDWVKSHPEIIKIISKSSRTLLHRIVALSNLLTIDVSELIDLKKDSGVLREQSEFQKYVGIIPLPEDCDLKGLDVLTRSHENLDWRILKNFHLTRTEQVLLRTQKIISFSEDLTRVEEAGVSFDEIQKVFLVGDPKILEVIEEEEERRSCEKEKENGNEDQSKGKLMRHMGKLWLKAEVRALESSLRSKLMSAYLVPDHEALAKFTPILKRLVYAKKFIIVIPSIVVQALDEMKRTSSQAREATRWLESQFRKGSRFLRAQRPHEQLALPYIKGPKPKDKDAWSFFQIIECCHYLTQQSNVGFSAGAGSPVVTFLTGTSVEERKSTSFSSDGLAKTAGINLEHIESFHMKWKTWSKRHG
ncbi:nonsense-mediated mRNA decay factor SMG5 [Diachasmimorpha longicaudata]|uniref:nonsense-mediated mRNA decay factor SMG5 n=1 Tax=Diachasmimorpha longicaudata TaxID=58733 RepID=UPI0030B8F6F9